MKFSQQIDVQNFGKLRLKLIFLMIKIVLKFESVQVVV